MRIIPLGGLDQIGMNITAFEYDRDIIVVDCGLAFPEDDMLGIDLVIPDTSYLEDNIDRVRGIVITHGHEDHIGAIPYVLQKLPVPLYGTRLTMALIEGKLTEHGMTDTSERHVISFGDVIKFGQMSVEFIRTNHSITDACALAITSPVGTIVHTGDFKVDYTPVFGDPIDLARFAELGKKGVLALLCDSTNAERPGFTNSEKTVGRAFDAIFSEHIRSRIIVATFSSNVDRVQQIFDAAQRYGRKVVLEGRSMVNIIKTAIDIGYVSIPDGILIDISQIKNYPDEKTVIITTGSQGESMAALSRIASNMHKTVSIRQGDVVVFSSNPIPGNEKAVFKVINELSLKGAEVIFQDTHVSGHACQEEIKLIYTLTRPKFAIPVHGEHRHLMAQRNVAVDVGIPKENVLILSNGQVLELDENSAKVVGDVANGAVFVDGLGVGDVGNVVLRDRQRLADDGIVIVCMTLEPGTNIVIAGPVVMSRGFVYIKESDEFMLEATEVVRLALEKIQDKNITSRNRIRDNIKDALSSFIWKRIKRSPMILPIIMENETGFGD
ncbi:MAG: ribonuclease J [Lachnospiraceae bacterium]|nr:ribonuclease J [Lachnospiraceae bacterium]